ncbi:SMEK2_1 [Blepharisma stoltei]|uniref:Serine/threonine-protein phosphatase 4 regulatory subunit 3-like central domain-containing protein n=1 Tax=Blepharisma stoltei TaxID=1481888 RepID=A0AAU9KIN8_9CILI|nr:unnamed protein product [Blepharisma stoltei]
MTSDNDKFWRVKLYTLGGNGEWNDSGTGRINILGRLLSVESEGDPDINLMSFEIGDEVYKRQGNTIITWMDNENHNFALSFQDPAGAQKVIEAICKIQSRDPKDIKFEDDNDEDIVTLPVPKIDNLDSIREILENSVNKDKISKAVLFSDFLEKLQKVYKFLEEENNEEKLYEIFFCYKALVQLNSREILDIMLSDEYYLDFFGALEHDPSILGKSFKLREILENQVKYQNVLEIEDKEFLAKIHHAYRLQFLKDTALSRCLDESSFQSLLCYQLYSWRELVAGYLESQDIRKSLFDKIQALNEGAINFFCELSSIAKTCTQQMKMKIDFYEEIHKDGIMLLLYNAQKEAKNNDELKEKILELIGEMYTNMLEVAPNIVKSYLISGEQKEREFEILKAICSGFLNSKNIGVQQEVSKFIKALLEPTIEDKIFLDICEIFYNELLNRFAGKMCSPNLDREEIRMCICEILGIFTHCVEKHQERIRTYLTMNEILQKALDLLQLHDKPISLAVLKLFREVIKRNDPYLTRYVVSHSYFQLIFEEFIHNGPKENMIFSSILAIFEEIKAAKNKVIIEHIVQRYVPLLKDTDLSRYLEQIVNIHAQQKEAETEYSYKNWNSREVSAKEDEEYFDKSSDEDVITPIKRSPEILELKQMNKLKMECGEIETCIRGEMENNENGTAETNGCKKQEKNGAEGSHAHLE